MVGRKPDGNKSMGMGQDQGDRWRLPLVLGFLVRMVGGRWKLWMDDNVVGNMGGVRWLDDRVFASYGDISNGE